MDCLYLVDEPRSGLQNMQLDHQMLEFAAANEAALLRVYRWAEPTLTLGYFQKQEDRHEHEASRSLPCVRRATGGGAIVHHHDWTYSLALPPAALSADLGAAQPAYDCVHDAVVNWLKAVGLPASQWEEATCKQDKCSFLCFERRSRGDVVARDAKILGSAQRRLRGALLQHGSLLLSRSPFAPSLAGVQDLHPAWQPTTDLLKSFSESLATAAANTFQVKLQHRSSFNDLLSDQPVGRFGEASWENKR